MSFPETFKALADPVLMLRDGRMSAGEIASRFDMTAATISYHLSRLKKAGLVLETKEKNFIYYSLNISVFEEMMLWLSMFTEASEDQSGRDGESGPEDAGIQKD